MPRLVNVLALVFGILAAGVPWTAAGAQPLTPERAVELALRNNAQVIGAEAGVIEARGGVYGAYAGVLPSLSASLSRVESRTDAGVSFVPDSTGRLVATPPFDSEFQSTDPSVSANWSALRLSNWADLSSARKSLTASQLSRDATRNDVALSARRQFYEVVRSIKLADVSAGALRLARDDERRVRALFEVGSVSKSDLLKAQVRSAQSQLDQLTARNLVTTQRIALATLVGVAEAQLGELDTVLTFQPQSYDEAELLAEASRARPDLRAAETDLSAARSNLTAARLGRLPYVTASGSVSFNPESRNTRTLGGFETTIEGQSDRELSAQVALRWDVFDGLATDARVAAARGRVRRAEENRNALQRNLAGEVRQALLAYHEAVERDSVASRAVESATENLKLTQEKYNVGSGTILELIDAQVQLQRAQSDQVSALAAIRVAEAQIDRVRGRPR